MPTALGNAGEHSTKPRPWHFSHFSSCPCWCDIFDPSQGRNHISWMLQSPWPLGLSLPSERRRQAGCAMSWELTQQLFLYPALICWQQNTTSF